MITRWLPFAVLRRRVKTGQWVARLTVDTHRRGHVVGRAFRCGPPDDDGLVPAVQPVWLGWGWYWR
jgi:hypothetical protein